MTELDDKDFKIINVLKEDSRIAIRDIAKKTGLRPSTVHQRIVRLKKDKTIEKFTLKLDPKSVGEAFIVFMLVKTKPSIYLDNKLLQNSHVKEVFGITGEYDLLIKMKFKDVIEFNDFIIKFRKEQNVETTHTMVATASIKEEI
jgi:DNA-binding Lrp family transcriptional regulator